MTVTTLDTVGYEQNETATVRAEEQDRIPLTALPKLVWVAGSLFVLNLMFGIGMLITPNLETDPYGKEVEASDAASSKISPFTQTIDTEKRKVRVAAKLNPVTFVPPTQDEFLAMTTTPADVAPMRASELERQATRSRQLDLPRTSRVAHDLDLPVRTEHAVYHPGGPSSNDISPRRNSEREKQFVVIN